MWVMIAFFPNYSRQNYARAAFLLLAALSSVGSSVHAAPPGPLPRVPAQLPSGTESPLPVFEMHSGFWVNLHHFLYLQARLLKTNSASTDTGRGAAQPDELPVSLIGFPEADIHAWQDAVAFYTKDLAGRDLLLNGDMEIIN